MPEINVGGQDFVYGERSFGTNRGITIHRKGVAKDQHEYKFSPDPHNNDPWYNKHQPEFYRQAAEQIANVVVATDNYPDFGDEIVVHEETYTLEER